MKKLLVMLMTIGLCAGATYAGSGVGVYGSYLDADDPGPGFGGGIKFKTELAEFFALEVRASCITQFDEDDTDDGIYLIPLEGGLLLNLPLGEEVPLTLYGGGGAGYAIIPEADDIDLDDTFCFYGVGGVELGLGESASLFVEAQYRVIDVDGAETDDEEELEFDEDIKFGGLGINAGLLFRF